jgi:hypothetical protein
MTRWTGRLRQLMSGPKERSPVVSKVVEDGEVDNEGWKYLNRVRDKLDKLVEDFAKGRVNRAQFEELYAHYQNERNAVERLMTSRPSTDAWRMAVTEGQSINIRRRLAARVFGYAVYLVQDETPLRVYGEFASLEDKWVSPLLAKVKSNKLFVVGSFKTGNDEATCLCAVSGQFTTLLVLFSTEPARVQMQSLEDLHCHFEQANYRVLSRKNAQSIKIRDLVFPYAAAFE